MLDTFNKNLITAFQIVVRHDVANVGISVNGDDIYTVYEGEEELLRLLALSPLCNELEMLRDRLNEVLGKPEVRPATPEEELAEASDILRKHIESGYIEGYDCEDGHLVWHPMANDEDA